LGGIIVSVDISINQTGGLKSAPNNFGYSRIYHELVRTMTNYGFNVYTNDPACPVQIYLGPHPVPKSHHPDQFKIHFIDNESTLVLKRHLDGIKDVDEIWTGNFYARQAMIDSGIDPNKVFVYEHGLINDIYRKTLRGQNNKIKFLHVDSGSARKGAPYVITAFQSLRKIYGERVELTLKFTDKRTNKVIPIEEVEKYRKRLDKFGEGVYTIVGNLTPEGLVELENSHDVMIYPSEGEGFGIIPLEALATGMPVLSTWEWSSYEKFLHHKINSRIGLNGIAWDFDYGGDVVAPRLSSIIKLACDIVDNIEEVSNLYYRQAPLVVDDYDWQKITNRFMDSFISRIDPNMLVRK
jgi:glycosyltransferase involved in cell wall biosynthesis